MAMVDIVTPLVLAHGILNFPPSRNAVDADDPRWADGKFPKNDGSPGCTEGIEWDNFCGCWGSNGTGTFAPGQACLWFSQGCTLGCAACDPEARGPWNYDVCGSGAQPTVCKPEHRTTNRHAPCGSKRDWTRFNPWRSPGSAPVYDACGKAGGQNSFLPYGGATYYIPTAHAKVGDLGSQVLPRRPSGVVWQRGSTVQTSWTINANHGGGYQYRLCPRGAALTEACFQEHPLPFAQDLGQMLQFKHNATPFAIEATYVSEGTSPNGSTWVRNPIPTDPTDFPPPCGADADPFFPRPVPYSKVTPTRCWGNFPAHVAILDHLAIPRHLAPGEYVLGWRWDGEQSAQIWAACADVTITDAPRSSHTITDEPSELATVVAPMPAQAPAPTPSQAPTPINLTVYRITPRNYSGLANMDSGDSAGDVYFGLYEFALPILCATEPTLINCRNVPILSIPGFNVYTKTIVEVDPRFATYQGCNPSSATGLFSCRAFGTSCWSQEPSARAAFAGVCDPSRCRCAAFDTMAVGRSTCDMCDRNATWHQDTPMWRKVEALGQLLNGSWFSTRAEGQCRAPTDRVGVDCWWRARAQLRNVNASCVGGRVIAAVKRHGAACFARCGADAHNSTSACYIHCLFDTLVGGSMSKQQIVYPFEQAFNSADPADSGCPEVPPCPPPCHPPDNAHRPWAESERAAAQVQVPRFGWRVSY